MFKVDFRFRGLLPFETLEELASAQARAVPQQFGHSLLIGEVWSANKFAKIGASSKTIVCCLRCGCYAHHHAHSLASVCDPNRSGLASQKRRLRADSYPATHRCYWHWQVQNLRAATASQVAWVVRAYDRVPVIPNSFQRALDSRWSERPLFLAQYGLSLE